MIIILNSFLLKIQFLISCKVSIPLIPEEPKRPPTAYILFYREFLSKTRSKEHKKLNVADAAKLAGAGWARLSPDEKNVRKALNSFNLIYIDHLFRNLGIYRSI